MINIARIIQDIILIPNQATLDNTTFEENTTYLFKCGQEFFISKDIDGLNIKIGKYGNGSLPIFTGSQNVKNEMWTDEGGGIYSLTINDVKWLYIDNNNAVLANHGTWVSITDLPADKTKFSVNPSDLTGIETIGAYVVCRNTPWSFTRGHLITGYNNGEFTLDRARGYYDRTWDAASLAGVTQKINLYGLASYIKNNYDWAYEGGKLYIKLPSAPSNYDIHAVVKDYSLYAKNESITIKNIEIKNYFRAGIVTNEKADYNSILNCKIHNIREDGIRCLTKNIQTKIQHNEIYDCDVRGIYFTRHFNMEISYNHIYNIALSSNTGWLKDALDTTHYCLIAVTTSGIPAPTPIEGHDDGDHVQNVKINDNYIHDIAYAGLHVIKANGEIKRNKIKDCVKTMEDGGGIYVAWGLWDYEAFGKTYALEIAYNHISGIENSNWVKSCIYQDNGSGPNYVHHNILYDFSYNGPYFIGPLYVNAGSAFQIIEDNIVIVKNGPAFRHSYIDSGAHAIQAKDCQVNRNIFISLESSPDSLMYIVGNIYAPNGDSDNNYYITPYASSRVAYNNLSLASWQALYGTDANSRVKQNWLTYVDEQTAENTHVKLYTNETNEDITITAPIGYENIDGQDIGGQSLVVPANYGLVLLKSAN